MTRRSVGFVKPLPSDGAPLFVGVDYAAGADYATECKVEVQADGSIRVLDFREIPRGEERE